MIKPLETKICEHCGAAYTRKARRPVKGFEKQRTCSRACSAATRRKLVRIPCPQCSNEFMPESSRAKYCGKQCAAKAHTGKPSILGKSARYKKTNGKLEHRTVMETILGRPLVKGESVHHRNGDRADNSPQNLELWYSAQPAGQRVDDLIDYIIKHHRSKLHSHLSSLLEEQDSRKAA